MSTADLNAHRHSAPDPVGLQMLARELGAEAVQAVHLLEGGAACAVHRVDLLGGPHRSVVLKRFRSGNGAPDLEWQALGFAGRALVPSPAPLAFDPVGRWFGTPAIVMSLLPGHLLLTPDDDEHWTHELASALATVHSTDLVDYPVKLNRPAIWERLAVDGMADDRRLERVASAITILRRTEWETVFCHCDFHPGNTLFLDGYLTGVCDWASARTAPALSDVGRCRAALSVCPGGGAPDLFRDQYALMTGRSMEGLALWDLFSAYLTLQFGRYWMLVSGLGGANVTVEEATARISAFGDRAAAAAGLP